MSSRPCTHPGAGPLHVVGGIEPPDPQTRRSAGRDVWAYPDAWLAIVLVVLLLAAAGCGSGSLLAGRSGPPRASAPNRAAYVGEDGQVYVLELAGGDPVTVGPVAAPADRATTVTAPAGREIGTARWPAWAPDGSRVAYFRVTVDPTDTLMAAQLWSVAADGSDGRALWSATDRHPVYLAWAPDGGSIALLVQSESDLELLVVDAAGVAPPRVLLRGNPCYFVWSADSRAILYHLGGERSGNSRADLGIVRLGPPDEWLSLGVALGDFRAPGWSADGRRVAFVERGPDGADTISVVSPHGGDISRLATVRSQAALALSPDGARIAWTSRPETDRLLYDGLEVANTDGSAHVRVTTDRVFAFFWSPDDRTLAYVTVDRASGLLAWNLADADGANPRRLVAFNPADEQLRLLAFFDQYAISHGAWSPDSRSLVYAVGTPEDRRVFGVPGRGWVYALAVDGSANPRLLADGGFVAMPVPALPP